MKLTRDMLVLLKSFNELRNTEIVYKGRPADIKVEYDRIIISKLDPLCGCPVSPEAIFIGYDFAFDKLSFWKLTKIPVLDSEVIFNNIKDMEDYYKMELSRIIKTSQPCQPFVEISEDGNLEIGSIAEGRCGETVVRIADFPFTKGHLDIILENTQDEVDEMETL